MSQPPQISQMDPVGSTPVRLAAKEAELSKILLHIDSASPQKFVTLLDKADGLLKAARERNANLLGLIIVGKLFMAALSRADNPRGDFAPFYLYIDEFQNITTIKF